MSEESMKPPFTSDNNFALKLTFIYNGKIGTIFKGIRLIQDDNTSSTHRNAVDLFISTN